MTDVFITSTLKAEQNRELNPKLCAALEARGLTCHLPQRDTDQDGTPQQKFQQNVAGVKAADVNLCVAFNESINLGAETGFAAGFGKPVVALKEAGHDIPVMLRGLVTREVAVDTIEDPESYADELVAAIRHAQKGTS